MGPEPDQINSMELTNSTGITQLPNEKGKIFEERSKKNDFLSQIGAFCMKLLKKKGGGNVLYWENK